MRRQKLKKKQEMGQRGNEDAINPTTLGAMNMTFTNQPSSIYGRTVLNNSTTFQLGGGQTTSAANSTTMINILNRYQQRRDGANSFNQSFTSMGRVPNATQFGQQGNTTMFNATQG